MPQIRRTYLDLDFRQQKLDVGPGKVIHVEKNHTHNVIDVWYEVEVGSEHLRPMSRRFQIVPTGGSTPPGYEHVGTVSGLKELEFTLHIYREIEQAPYTPRSPRIGNDF